MPINYWWRGVYKIDALINIFYISVIVGDRDSKDAAMKAVIHCLLNIILIKIGVNKDIKFTAQFNTLYLTQHQNWTPVKSFPVLFPIVWWNWPDFVAAKHC